ncbi:hypothetical protein TCAL_03065 [Tigriopus californicus]|uniref:Disease resistance R13L4/SHOC-2-like LRR domain-containing protein n=1 Tax=Tigriopus californicus TaxID=6832 RepID=A0A553NT28_TIGCA|nr:hypothetical protein TCAL_03065 [Tigriopus californicus]|eukprot:TCALIF_03065-PA protein Name:"Similar to LRRC40 Leucine-rich repeat-containing protein 40 (Gallus gallus)" AED:0.30 eAED:0.30 QI:157/0/0.5/1/1/1/2/0/671
MDRAPISSKPGPAQAGAGSGSLAMNQKFRGPKTRLKPSAAFMAAARQNQSDTDSLALTHAQPSGSTVAHPSLSGPSVGAVFQSPTPSTLHPQMMKQARASGQLNLSGRGLVTVPEQVWHLQAPLPEESAQAKKGFSLDQVEPWWEQVSLTKLILASNQLTLLPANLGDLSTLTVLDLHDNMLKELPNEIGLLTCLSKLNVSHNRLSGLPPDFYRLASLRDLNLSKNELRQLSDEISQLNMLQKLDVSYNDMAQLPSAIGYLTKITHFNLSDNRIQDLPLELSFLRNLVSLDANRNQLATLGDAVSDLTKLELLYVSHNKIQSFPNLKNCSHLKELHMGFNSVASISTEDLECVPNIHLIDLRDNKLKEVPKEIVNLQSLERLDVSNNDLNNLPFTLGTLPNLKLLLVEGNPIKSIRRDIIQRGTLGLLKYLRSRLTEEELSTLRDKGNVSPVPLCGSAPVPDKYAMKSSHVLNMTKKEISSLPDEAVANAKDAHVTGVDLSKNFFKEIPSNLKDLLPSVYEFNMSGNKLELCPAWLGTLGTHLQYLNLGNNRLSDLPPELAQCQQLRELTVPYNKLTQIPSCVYALSKLETLIMEGNQISEIIIDELAKLSRLAILDLQNNNVSHVPPELGLMTQLRSLQLEGNAFRVPRAQVLVQGTEAILSYLRDRIPK